MGLFITFEGIEGCGKTTQLRMAGDYLMRRSVSVISTVEPGGTSLGQKIREMLLNRGSDPLCREAELLLFCAARSQHVKEVIAPALAGGRIVLCDRFADATVAYQGYGRRLDIDWIKTLTDFSANHLKPDLTFLFDLTVEEGLSRAFDRIARNPQESPEDRFEREETAFHRRVREGYLDLARREPDRFRVIDASREIAVIHEEVRRHLAALIEERQDVL